jgi:hypothetical protein
MDRRANEAEYVLAVLRRMREEVTANPQLFDPDAQERIDKAIAFIEGANPRSFPHSGQVEPARLRSEQ